MYIYNTPLTLLLDWKKLLRSGVKISESLCIMEVHQIMIPCKTSIFTVLRYGGVQESSPIMLRSATHREIFSKSYSINPKSDCIYHFPIDLDLNKRPFGSKSNGNVKYNLISV